MNTCTMYACSMAADVGVLGASPGCCQTCCWALLLTQCTSDPTLLPQAVWLMSVLLLPMLLLLLLLLLMLLPRSGSNVQFCAAHTAGWPGAFYKACNRCM